MKRITAVTVTYEDGRTETWRGLGSACVHHTSAAKGAAPADIHYVDATLKFEPEEKGT